MKPIELYTTAGCPYSEAAREDLEWRGVEFIEYDVDEDKPAGECSNSPAATGRSPSSPKKTSPSRSAGWAGDAPCDTSAGQPSGHVGGMVGDDDVGPGAFDACQRFDDGPLFVEPPVLDGGFDHRVLPAHVVSGEG
jgi:glutaredoxin 3